MSKSVLRLSAALLSAVLVAAASERSSSSSAHLARVIGSTDVADDAVVNGGYVMT